MLKLRRVGVAVCALAATAFVGASALAGPQDFWATGGDGTTLVRINKTTGVGTTVGTHGLNQAWAAAWDNGGTLWTTFNGFSGNARLGKFNTATGAITAVGGGLGTNMICLETSAGGQMYGVGYSDARLYKINTGAGTSSVVGNTGLGNMMDLAFDNSGALWAVNTSNRLYKINTATGASTLVTTLTGVSGEMGIGFDALGTLFLTNYTSNSGLYTVNTTTGAATFVGSTGIYRSHGGDFEPVVIPLPSTMLMALVGFGGVLLVRRKFC